MSIITPDMSDGVALSVISDRLSKVNTELDNIWILFCSVIVFTMQLGFCFLEAGGVRSTNVINILFKNLGDCAIGGLCWWLVGYSVAVSKGSFVGIDSEIIGFAPKGDSSLLTTTGPFLLSYVYMTTAVTIVSGAVAERISLVAYYILVVVMTAFAYPVVVHWVWNGSGWLSAGNPDRVGGYGVIDFAGSAVIHLFGGTCAFVFSYLIGPRSLIYQIDVFSKEGIDIIEPHNKFQQATGTLMLWFGWYAFNMGSVPAFSGGGSNIAAAAAVATCVASGSATVFGILISRVFFGYYNICHACNCALVGLVSITAGCGTIAPAYAPVVGIIGVCAYFAVVDIRSRLKIDDVVDASAVHMGGGIWGTLCVAFFADSDRIQHVVGPDTTGVSVMEQFGVQLLGTIAIMSWAGFVSAATFYILKYTVGVRVTSAEELRGLDFSEHRTNAYDYIESLEIDRRIAIEAVDVAQRVAEAMISFDLQLATRVLGYRNTSIASNDKLEEDADQMSLLKIAMRNLIRNLTAYKPYLPAHLFSSIQEQEEETSDVSSETDCRTMSAMSSESVLFSHEGAKVSNVVVLTVQYRFGSHSMSSSAIENSTLSLVSGLEAIIAEGKGCIHKIEGGRLIATWSGYANNPIHAAKTALHARDHFRVGVQASIVMGSTMYGNMGTVDNKFVLLYGDLGYKCDLLLAVAESLSNPNPITHAEVATKLGYTVLLKPIDKLIGGSLTRTFEAHAVEGLIQTEDTNEEWMYELEEKGAQDPYSNYRLAWAAFKGKSFAEATEHLTMHLAQHPSDTHARHLLTLAEDKVSPETVLRSHIFETYPSDQ